MRYSMLIGCFAAMLANCDSPTALRSAVSAVVISPSSNGIGNWISLQTGNEIQLGAVVTRMDGTAAPDEVVTWESTAPQLATVDSTGLVKAAATYTACGVFEAIPFGCYLSVIATAGGKADTVSVLVTPTIVYEFPPETTLLVGDSVSLSAVTPVATVDGEVRCTYFVRFILPDDILRRSGPYLVAAAPGVANVEWGPSNNLCRAGGAVSSFRVIPRP